MKKLIVCSFAVFTLLYALCPMLSFPGVPGKLNYQGKLTDNQGNLITGTRDINFALYTDAVSSFAVWTEGHATVTVTNSLFNVVLGESKDLSSIFEDYDSLYLEIEVAGETLLPRQEMASAGYALKAQSTYQDAAYPMETYVVKAGGTPGVDCDFTTLSEAVSASPEGNCSIFIKNGTYTENIVLNDFQNAIIRGESHDAIIRNSGTANTITLQGECINVVIKDLRIEIGEDGYSALSVNSGDCSRCTISGCEIVSTASGAAYGINTSEGANFFTIENNYLESTWNLGNGINGLFANSLFQGNMLMNWKKGFCFMGGQQNNTVTSNQIVSNGDTGTVGFSMETCGGNNRFIISDNRIIEPEIGIYIGESQSNVITSNYINGGSGTMYGIQTAGDSRWILLGHNRIHMSTSASGSSGIYLGGGGHIEVSGNQVYGGWNDQTARGIYSETSWISIMGNHVCVNLGTAIEINTFNNFVTGNFNYADESSGGNCLKETAGSGNVYNVNWNNDTS